MTTKQLDVDKVHEAIDTTIQALNEKEDQLREMEIALTNFVNLEAEFRGQGGQAIRDFYATCHIPFIQLLRLFSEDYEHILQQIKQSLDFVEPAPGGFIDQAFIENDVQDGLDRVSQTAMALTDSANETLRSIQDIISIPLIDDSDVQQTIHVAKKEANSVVDKVLQFDHTGTVSLQSIKDNLKTLGKYVMEMHEAMGGGHLSVKDFSVDQLHYLPTHSKLTEVLQERSTEIKSTADPREEELAILEAERAAIEAEELARLEAEQAAIEAEEARLAEQQALEEVEEDKSWWSKTVSAVTDTVEKTIDTVGNAASSAYNYVTENPAASLSAVVDFVPVVGNLKAGIEAATGYDPLTGRRLEPWERAVAGGAILGGAAVKGASKVAKFAKNTDKVGDVARVSTGNAPVPIKQGGGSNPKDFVNPHSEKHMYDPSRPSTPNRSQYGENVDVSKLRKETVANPDKAYSNWPNPNNPNPNKITKYYKEFEGNISTPNTPTGSHRVFDNIGNPTRSSHFPYVPRK